MTPATDLADTIHLTFAADTRNIAVARTLTASMAARADLPLDQLEDARLAVDEALTVLIEGAVAGSTVTCTMTAAPGSLDVHVSAEASAEPSRTTFSWTVLSALADELDARLADGRLTIMLTISRHDA